MSHLNEPNTGGKKPLIKEAQARLWEAMLSSFADFVYAVDLEGRLVYANRSQLNFWGKTWEEAAGRNFFDLGYPPELSSRLHRQIQDVIRTGEPMKDETTFTDSRGNSEFYEYLFTPVLSEGRIVAVSGTTRIITARKNRETELTELTRQKETQARFFNATLSSINDLAYTFDLEGNWTYANKPLLELWGKTLEEITGKSSLQLGYPPELADRLKQQVKRVIATRQPFKGETFFTSGAGVVDYHEYIFSPVFGADGSVEGVCGTTRLITERKRNEEQLRQRSERMQLLSETLAQLLSARDPETVVRELFPKVASHLGVDTYFNYMVNEQGSALKLHSSAGVDAETLKQMEVFEFGQAISGTVAQTRTAIVANDIQNSEYDKAAFVRSLGIQTYACNPLVVGDRLLGTLSFASRTRTSFEADELEFIKVISQHTAIALDRMQNLRALRQSEAQISAIINKSPLGIYLVDSQLRLRHVNPKAEPVFRNIQNVIGSNFVDVLKVIWPAEAVDRLVARFRRTLETGEPFFESGFASNRADSGVNEFYDWEIHRITLPDGQFGVVCYFIDISAHVRAQLKIQESAEQLRLALMAANQGDWAWNAETDRLTLSERAAEIFGVQAGDNYTRTMMRQLLVPEDREPARLALAKSIETKTDYSAEYRVKKSEHDIRWVAAYGRPTFRNDGTLDGMLGVVQDITQRKESEDALRESNERLESRVEERTLKLQETIAELESFSYSISHDLRAPLRAMQSFAEILEEECGPQVGEEGKDYIRRIVRSAERMDRLIQDILVFSRVARADLKLEPVNLGSLLRSILESYPQFEPAKVDVELVEPLPPVLANEAALTQCVSNLFGNAIKFIDPGVKPRLKVWTNEGEGRVRLFIQDNGIGIEKEAHERIFGIFQQLHKTYEGTGIGLAIVKKAAERMGGSVGLESELNQGSTFWLDLSPARADS